MKKATKVTKINFGDLDFKPTFNRVIVEEMENPYKKDTTDAGIITSTNSLLDQRSGKIESQQDIFRYGVIREVGPDCELLEVGDRVIYNCLAFGALIFEPTRILGIINERDVTCYERV